MKFTKKKIAIIIASIIVVAGGVFACLYFFTDMFKSTQELFYEYVGKSAKTEGNYTYQDMLEELKIAQTKSFTGSSTIGIELKDKGNSISSIQNQAAFDALKNIKLKVETKSNPSENKASYNIGINYDDKKIADVNLVKTNDLYGIKSDLIDSKYVAIENNNLRDFASKFGAYTAALPDKIEEIDLYDLLYISKEDQDRISNTYKNVLKDSIPSSKYTKIDNVKKTINGTEQNLTGYSLKLSGDDITNVLNNFLEKAKDDDTTLNIIVEKINKLLNTQPFKTSLEAYQTMANSKLADPRNPYASTGSIYAKQKTFEMPEITKETLKQGIEQLINQLKTQTSNNTASNVDIAEIVVYVANGKTARMELNVAGMTAFAVDFYEENGNNHAVVYAAQQRENSYYSYTYAMDLVKLMEIEYNVKQNGNEKKSYIGMTIFKNDEQVAKISFDITANGKVGTGTNTEFAKISVETEEIDMTLNIDSKIEYTDNVEVEEINSSNATILNNMSKAEIEAYFNKISGNLQGIVPSMSTMPTTTIPTITNPFENLDQYDYDLGDDYDLDYDLDDDDDYEYDYDLDIDTDELEKRIRQNFIDAYGVGPEDYINSMYQ